MPIETQKARRGHIFYPPSDLHIPDIYQTEGVSVAEKVVLLHYFCTAGDWWIVEYDPITTTAFGYVRLAAYPEDGEWGYINLAELEGLNALGGMVIVERDLDWLPTRFSEIGGLS